MRCHYCGKPTGLRPYGPRGAMVCFACAMSTPERQEEAETMFAAQLNASGNYAAIDGTAVGPYPLQHKPKAHAAVMEALGEKMKGGAA